MGAQGVLSLAGLRTAVFCDATGKINWSPAVERVVESTHRKLRPPQQVAHRRTHAYRKCSGERTVPGERTMSRAIAYISHLCAKKNSVRIDLVGFSHRSPVYRTRVR